MIGLSSRGFKSWLGCADEAKKDRNSCQHTPGYFHTKPFVEILIELFIQSVSSMTQKLVQEPGDSWKSIA